MLSSLPGIVSLARNRDDAPPEWRWAWEGLVVAWVPCVDGNYFITPTGRRRASVNAGNAFLLSGQWKGVSVTDGMISCELTAAERDAIWAGSTNVVDVQKRGVGTWSPNFVYGAAGPTANFDTAPRRGIYLVPNKLDVQCIAESSRYRTQWSDDFSGTIRRRYGWSTQVSGTLDYVSSDGATDTWSNPFGSHAGSFSGQYYFFIGSSGTGAVEADVFSSVMWGVCWDQVALDKLTAVPLDRMFRWRRRVTYSVPAGGTLYTRSFAGSINSAGVLTKRTKKPLAGGMSTAGILTKKTSKRFAGGLNTAGVITKKTKRLFVGAINTAGTISNSLINTLYSISFAGVITSAGVLTKRTKRSFSGSLSSAGTLVKKLAKTFSGAVATSGVLAKKTSKRFTGSVSMAGLNINGYTFKRTITGLMNTAGTLVNNINPIIVALTNFLPKWWFRRRNH